MTPVVLVTPRLHLRPLSAADAPVLAAYRADPAVAAFQGWTLPYTPQHAHALIAEMAGKQLGDAGWVQYGVSLPGGALVGDVALRTHGAQAEFGVTLAPSAHGRGYATEAGAAVIAHAFGTLGLHRLHASIDPRNVPVARLLVRLGFRHEGTLVEAYEHRGAWTDDALYGLLRREWASPD
ncbi:RimJ/RimL family protein N-acetyltransferase [Deinococcus metalli]|uniref:RimJ/RimL family protein N-acetyltransferase n=1 Tax=Deinococcus metalli TaxID=1141878 RepID=A0A7W8KHD7_9DEIO|nr:GNAT family protein [Deinococcus metalli]MBB5378145.1 RimJ/RimL family protein N-acetyltransferase [Deinococcus metalli]